MTRAALDSLERAPSTGAEHGTSAKLCECGCGQPAPIAKDTNRRLGYIKGQPVRFVQGHNARVEHPHKPGTRPSRPPHPDDYTVNSETGCWEWRHAVNRHGYGMVWRGGHKIHAHRFFFQELVGPIPDGFDVDHLCRNRRCVNPAHLEAVPRAVNLRRGNGTILSEQDVIEIRRLARDGISSSQLAAFYGCSRANINSILRGKSWRDIDLTPEQLTAADSLLLRDRVATSSLPTCPSPGSEPVLLEIAS